MPLTQAQIDILDFTLHRAPNELYCCSFDDPNIKVLTARGLMTKLGRASFVPSQEGYFGITSEGRNLFNDASPRLQS